MRETERKLAVNGPFDLPDLSQLEDVGSVAEASQQRLRATYYDTEGPAPRSQRHHVAL